MKVPRVLPDGCVDTSSLDGIVKGLVKPGMSDQEKVLAVYQWWRRVTFHFRNMGADRRDTLRVINSYGYNLCGSHSGSMMVLFKHMGIKARPAFVKGASAKEGYGGHTVEEVFYGGKWHAFDVMSNFCVLNRDDPPTIAGLAEIQKDPTLVTKAVEEKRTVGGFITCTHDPDIDYAGREQLRKLGWGGWMTKEGLKGDLRWGCLIFGYTDAQGKDHPGDLKTFWSKAANNWSCNKAGDLYGGYHAPGLLDITLKPNERWVMLWDNLGMWTVKSSFPKTGPFHTCGHCDELDEVNFKYFEPYAKKGLGGTKVCYRYYANGFLEWTPQSAAEVEAAGKKAGGGLSIPVKAPGPVVGVEVDLKDVK
ncbi:MAG: transglutaminase domain-containing protein, partial [Planctomycetota bacterium]